MRNTGLEEAQAAIKIAGRNINNLRYADDTNLMVESEEELKISCMKRVASPGSMHGTECSGLAHWDDPEGGYGEGGGRRVQDGVYLWWIHFDVWQN